MIYIVKYNSDKRLNLASELNGGELLGHRTIFGLNKTLYQTGLTTVRRLSKRYRFGYLKKIKKYFLFLLLNWIIDLSLLSTLPLSYLFNILQLRAILHFRCLSILRCPSTGCRRIYEVSEVGEDCNDYIL